MLTLPVSTMEREMSFRERRPRWRSGGAHHENLVRQDKEFIRPALLVGVEFDPPQVLRSEAH